MDFCRRLQQTEPFPGILREGISDADMAAELYETMVKEGHQGMARFGMFDSGVVVAQLGFRQCGL